MYLHEESVGRSWLNHGDSTIVRSHLDIRTLDADEDDDDDDEDDDGDDYDEDDGLTDGHDGDHESWHNKDFRATDVNMMIQMMVMVTKKKMMMMMKIKTMMVMMMMIKMMIMMSSHLHGSTWASRVCTCSRSPVVWK